MTLTNDQVLKLVNQIQLQAFNLRPSKHRDSIIRMCDNTIESIVSMENLSQ